MLVSMLPPISLEMLTTIKCYELPSSKLLTNIKGGLHKDQFFWNLFNSTPNFTVHIGKPVLIWSILDNIIIKQDKIERNNTRHLVLVQWALRI